MKSGIYKILSWIDGKVYIGCATNLRKRLGGHRYDLRRNIHSNKHLQSAWNKYGENNFQFLIIEYCEKEKLLEKEQYWIDKTNCCHYNYGYNIATVAGLTVGIQKTEEWKINHSKTMKGRVRPQEEKDRISAGMKGKQNRLGTKDSEATREIRRQAALNKSQAWSDAQSAGQRKLDKWPHNLGSRCKCKECKNRRRQYRLRKMEK